MLRLSKKTMFAVEAVLDIAFHAAGGTVRSHDITRRQGIPKRYLEQALQQLVRHGILVGVRGPRGGYHLARERRRTTVGEIVRVVGPSETAEPPNTHTSPLALKVTRPAWADVQDKVLEHLDAMTMEDLCARAEAAGIPSEGRANLDFSI